MDKIKYIIIHFLYEHPLEPINVSLLTEELRSLNPILEHMEVPLSETSSNSKKQNNTKKRKKTKKLKTRKIR